MTEALRVLIVEDSETDARLIAQELGRLKRPLDVTRVDHEEAMHVALERGAWDVILCDWSLPGFGALAALDLAKRSAEDTPFIVVSGTIGEEKAVDAMRRGAHDFVLKDRLARLAPAIERELRDSEERRARKRAEAALLASQKKFARLADSGILAIVHADVRGNTLDANDAYLRLIGCSREELLEVRWNELTPPEWRHTDERALAELAATGVSVPWEKEMLRRDGSRVPVLVGVAMLDDVQCIVFIADLTAQKRAEAALSVSEEQLRQAQKMEAVGRLAGGIAHDFNNLLSVIQTYGDLMLAELPPETQLREDLEEIRRAATRAADLTRQLLMFSRQQVLSPKVVDLNDTLATVEKMLGRILGEDVELVIINGREIGTVRVDPGSIDQLIMNLAVNARDAMPTGGTLTLETARVVLGPEHVRAHPGSVPGPHVVLAITDTGTGMAPETMERIFEPFFTTKGPGKGTGLGLSTAFGIVQQSGGSITVESERGRGTTFRVYLPAVDAAPSPLLTSRSSTSSRGTETILVVEDDDQVRTAACGILRRNGYLVLQASSAEDAQSICKAHGDQIHLLLTDVVMPHISGPELAKRLLELRPQMKVLCMSGYTDDSIIRHGVYEDRLAFLDKPFTPDSLTLKVRQVLDTA
jgi:hypothetical protein